MEATSNDPENAPGPPPRLSRWMNGWGKLLEARRRGEISTRAYDATVQRIAGLPFGEKALLLLEGALGSSVDSASEPGNGDKALASDARVAERVAKDLGWH